MSEPLMSLPEQASNGMLPIYLLVGSLVVKELVGAGREWIKGAFDKKAQLEDKAGDDLKKRVEDGEKKHEATLKEITEKYDEKFDDLDDDFKELERSVDKAHNELKQVRDTLESIRSNVVDFKNGLDQRFEKQAAFYRDTTREYTASVEKKLEELEYKLRNDMTRAVSDVVRQMEKPPARGRRSSD